MPWPLSRTVRRTLAPSRRSRASTRPPRSVNFTAFDSRFQTTCCSRSASPLTGGSVGVERRRRWRSAWRPRRARRRRWRPARPRSSDDRVDLQPQLAADDRAPCRAGPRPAAAATVALRSMTSSACARDRTDGCVRRIRVQPITAFSGVRISCDSVARNSSFSRDASSASLPRLLGRGDLVAQLALGITRSVTSSISVIVPTTVAVASAARCARSAPSR